MFASTIATRLVRPSRLLLATSLRPYSSSLQVPNCRKWMDEQGKEEEKKTRYNIY